MEASSSFKGRFVLVIGLDAIKPDHQHKSALKTGTGLHILAKTYILDSSEKRE
jgi:hypothetical protein